MLGVSTVLAPYTPTRSARSVSIVTMSTLAATAGGGAGRSAQAAQSVKAAKANESVTMSRERSVMRTNVYCLSRRESGIVFAQRWPGTF